jgi:hypothetical protein
VSLIFNRFKTEDHARRLMARISELYPELESQLFTSDAEAQEHDAFPGALTPPIVHVDLMEDERWEEEAVIEALVEEFGGGVRRHLKKGGMLPVSANVPWQHR